MERANTSVSHWRKLFGALGASTFGFILPAFVFSTPAMSSAVWLQCSFDQDFTFFITENEDGKSARIGVEPNVGSKADAFYDAVTGARFYVEYFADGALPSTFTTVLKDGSAVHSRHTIDTLGNLRASQLHGTCKGAQQ